MPSSRFGCAAALGLAILTALTMGCAVAAPVYTITDLGSRGAWGINNAGQVVGAGDGHLSPAGSPYLYQNGVFTDLSGKVGTSAYISKINNAATINRPRDYSHRVKLRFRPEPLRPAHEVFRPDRPGDQ